MSKRVFDIVVSLIGIVILFPVFICTAILIKIDDFGPIFYKQERIGRLGKKFTIYKFRTMAVTGSENMGNYRPGDRTRITRLGFFLRAKKIDELPQLINVLVGNMSLVGPRPEVEQWVSAYPIMWRQVLMIRPGMTDNASIEFRNEEELLSKSVNPDETYYSIILPRKLDLYTDYVKKHCLRGDIIIILRTLKAVFRNES